MCSFFEEVYDIHTDTAGNRHWIGTVTGHHELKLKNDELKRKDTGMKGFENNEMSVRTLNNLKGSLDNRIHEIYNQGYREGFKDGQTDMAHTFLEGIRDMVLGGERREE